MRLPLPGVYWLVRPPLCTEGLVMHIMAVQHAQQQPEQRESAYCSCRWQRCWPEGTEAISSPEDAPVLCVLSPLCCAVRCPPCRHWAASPPCQKQSNQSPRCPRQSKPAWPPCRSGPAPVSRRWGGARCGMLWRGAHPAQVCKYAVRGKGCLAAQPAFCLPARLRLHMLHFAPAEHFCAVFCS